MDTNGQHLAETYLEMLNTHEPDLVNRFVAEDYRNHNAYVADGREANRQFWTAFLGIPASGNPVEMRSIDIWRVEDGMFAEHWDELNLLEMFQQMGALPPLGAGPERDA